MAEIEIIQKTENKTLNRQEIELKILSTKTPSRKDLLKKISEKLKAKEDLIIIEKIKTNYGIPTVTIKIRLYKDGKNMKNLEKDYLIKRLNSKKDDKEQKTENKTDPEKKEEVKENTEQKQE